MHETNTIAAISTAHGHGAIGVIRVSGEDTFSIVEKVFKPVKKGLKLSEQEGYTVHFGKIVSEEEVVDEVLLSIFKNPKSYTGEDSVEISCHGSQYIQQEILSILLNKGCELAKPGEFTQRAYLNGKMDLSQSEAVADLIAAENKAAHNLAMRQMKGSVSKEINTLREHLLNFASLIELELDFSEEDVEFADRTALNDLLNKTLATVNSLIQSFTLGNAIKKGIPVAIVGAPNAGKSTLLNALLKENRAIVSDIEGTTRDTIEDEITLQGVSFRFIDTAGIRETSDTIEKLGIERTLEKVKEASIVLWLLDVSKEVNEQDYLELKTQLEVNLTPTQSLITVGNKADKLSKTQLPSFAKNFLLISAKEGEKLEELETALLGYVEELGLNKGSVAISSTRHRDALNRTKEALEKALEALQVGISGDLMAMDIRQALHYLGEITGAVTVDEVLGNIFSKFCIGK